MYLVNIDYIPGFEISAHFGLVTGSTVQSKHLGTDIMAKIKNLFGGELHGYSALLEEAREEATKRMILSAKAKGANAIINIRFSTSSVANNAAEIYVYGTAVKVKRL